MDNNRPGSAEYILSLDIGVASVGWCAVRLAEDGRPAGILAVGSHLFESGTDGGKGGIEAIAQGSDQPRNQVRRLNRQMRRQTWRRARRKRKLLRLLIEHGLLPPAETTLQRPLDIDAYMKALDGSLARRWLAGASHADHQRMPYLIRAAAATRAVDRYDVGRALYHLAQRRGFLSNRRADAKQKDDEDKSKVKASIGELQARIDGHITPLLGAYLASLNPDEQRLRGRWTSRAMYLREFDAIWAQQASTLGLEDAAKTVIARAIFHQRPLKSQKNLIGRCSLMPGESRCPIAHRLYQKFRVLQAVNNLEVAVPGQAPRSLTSGERASLLARLLGDGDATFTQVRRAIGAKRTVSFNLEEGGEKKLIGHRTDARLREVFGGSWEGLPEELRDQVVEDVRSFRLAEALARRGKLKWGLSPEASVAFGQVTLEEGYAPLSLAAIRIVLPRLEEGIRYATARRELFPESFKGGVAHDVLPPVDRAIPDLRNPTVMRSLTEVRKLVNAAVRRWGKPARIRVELAREVKNPRGVRERMARDNRAREKQRDAIRARILKEAGIANPSRDDIEKVLLAEECGWECPYTGRHFGMADLVGRTPQYDVEHIWPKSRSLDDGFLNKTICYHEENRSRKRGHTPHEAYAGDPERYRAIIGRVERFGGDSRARAAKLARFLAEEIDPDFANRHLSDTRYIAREAAEYLGLLYGGRVQAGEDADQPDTRRVEVCTGGLTAWLRTGWGLGRLLGDSAEKNREDHRHHAIDAIVIALSDPRAVQSLARAAERADREFKRRAFESIDEPWPGFREQVAAAIDGVVVSHRQSRKVSGALHEATNYSKPVGESHRVRKELQKLTPADVERGKIVDKRALAAIRTKLEALGKPRPSAQDLVKIFSDPANAPMVAGHGGKLVRLRKVRVDAGPGAARIGKGASERHVQTGSNHHTVIYAELDSKGDEKSWGDEPVTLMECYRRQAAREPIVKRALDPGKRFLFSLAKGEYVELDVEGEEGRRAVYRVTTVSDGDNWFKEINNAQPKADAMKSGAYVRAGGNKLRKLRARKVLVTYLGEVRNAGG